MKKILVILSCFMSMSLFGQRLNNTLSKTRFNIAILGRFDGQALFSVKNIHSKIPASFTAYDLLVDFKTTKNNFGIFVSHKQIASVSTTSLAGHYVYELEVNPESSIYWGIQAGLVLSKLQNSYLFADQFSVLSNEINNSSEKITTASQMAFDVNASVLWKNNRFQLGFSALHLNKPQWTYNQEKNITPIGASIISSYRFDLSAQDEKGGVYLDAITYGQFLDKKNISLASQLVLDQYQGFAGKITFGMEWGKDLGKRSHFAWYTYLGYSQDKVEIQYTFGANQSYQKTLGSQHQIIVGYTFD